MTSEKSLSIICTNSYRTGVAAMFYVVLKDEGTTHLERMPTGCRYARHLALFFEAHVDSMYRTSKETQAAND